jgi:hypothetical protein
MDKPVYSRLVHTRIGNFTIEALENARGQRVWHITEVPGSMGGGRLDDPQPVNAYDGDELGGNAAELVRSMLPKPAPLPEFTVKTRVRLYNKSLNERTQKRCPKGGEVHSVNGRVKVRLRKDEANAARLSRKQ